MVMESNLGGHQAATLVGLVVVSHARDLQCKQLSRSTNNYKSQCIIRTLFVAARMYLLSAAESTQVSLSPWARPVMVTLRIWALGSTSGRLGLI